MQKLVAFRRICGEINANSLFKALVTLNILFATIAFTLGSSSIFPDAANYIALGESILSGNYSSSCNAEYCLPDTVRTPGYPVILAIFFLFSKNMFYLQIIQLLFYFASLCLAYKILYKITKGNVITANIFLTFTAFNIQIPYYSGAISTEIFTIFFLTLYFYYLFVAKKNNLVLSALISGCIIASLFYLRPGFLILPFILFGLSYFKYLKMSSRFFALQIVFFLAMLLPYGNWNHNEHGVFRLTPVGVSGMVALNGYWFFKLPEGYVNKYMWNEIVIPDATSPFSYSLDQQKLNQLKYEAHWDDFLDNNDISEGCVDKEKILLTYKDQVTCNPSFSNYILKRETFVKNELISLFLENKNLYIKERVYSFFRLFFTGVNIKNYDKNESFTKTLVRIYPFAITFFSIFIGFIFSLLYLRKLHKSEIQVFIPMLVTVAYVAASHSVFPIQARYLVPLHLLILVMFSIVLEKIPKELMSLKNKILKPSI